jgi:hypothetical protein
MKLKVREYLRGYENMERKYPLNLKHVRVDGKFPRKEKKELKKYKRFNNLRALVMIVGMDRSFKGLEKVNWLNYLKNIGE